jgi:endo-1,3(4)-beta-glucanase
VDWRDTMSDDESLFEIKDGNLILLGKMNTDLQKDHSHHTTHSINPNDYNIYGVEWDNEAIRFYVNNKHTYTYKREAGKESEGQYPFTNEPYYLLIDMQLGGKWVGEVQPFDKPIRMYIDWVRYYQK